MRKFFGVFYAIAVLALVWPGPALFASGQTRVFGLPLSFAWVVGWLLAMFVALVLLYRHDERGRR